MIKTLENLRLLFLEIATEHDKINAFYWGNFLRAQKDDTTEGYVHSYPLLVVDVESANLERNFVGIDLLITVADKVLKGHQNLNDTKSDTLQVIKHVVDTMNSPKWQSFSKVGVEGSAQWFMDSSIDEVSGWVVRVRLDIISQRNLCDMPMGDYNFDGTFISLCEPVKIFEDGVFKESVEAGGSFYYVTSGECEDATYELTIDGAPVESGTIPSGDTQQIPIDAYIGGDCEDATAVLKDTDGNIISSTTIASGVSADITAPDGVVSVFDASANLLYTVNVLSDGLESQTIINSTVNVQKSDAV
jgi:hypothetical protein